LRKRTREQEKDYLRLPLSTLVKAYQGAGDGTISWTHSNGSKNVIDFSATSRGVILRYCVRTGVDVQSFVQNVELAETAPHFGGVRRWMVCPTCERLCRVLFIGSRCGCSRCLGLSYEVQRQTAYQRTTGKLQRLMRKLGKKLGDIDPLMWKPRYMHASTFAKICNAIHWTEKKAVDLCFPLDLKKRICQNNNGR